MELKDIKAIIDLMKKNDLSVFEMEKDGFKLKLQKGAGEQTVFASGGCPVGSAAVRRAGTGAARCSSDRSSAQPKRKRAS